jgi:hypothetical protein
VVNRAPAAASCGFAAWCVLRRLAPLAASCGAWRRLLRLAARSAACLFTASAAREARSGLPSLEVCG